MQSGFFFVIDILSQTKKRINPYECMPSDQNHNINPHIACVDEALVCSTTNWRDSSTSCGSTFANDCCFQIDTAFFTEVNNFKKISLHRANMNTSWNAYEPANISNLIGKHHFQYQECCATACAAATSCAAAFPH